MATSDPPILTSETTPLLKNVEKIEPHLEFTIVESESSGVYKLKLVTCNEDSKRDMVEKYRSLFYCNYTNENKWKVVPNILFRSSKCIKQAYLEGFLAACNRKDIEIKGQIGCQGLYYLLNQSDITFRSIVEKVSRMSLMYID